MAKSEEISCFFSIFLLQISLFTQHYGAITTSLMSLNIFFLVSRARITGFAENSFETLQKINIVISIYYILSNARRIV